MVTTVPVLEVFSNKLILFILEKFAQITGTGHGIGKELALQYTALGCQVICVDINEANNDRVVEEANSLRMGTAYGYKCVRFI